MDSRRVDEERISRELEIDEHLALQRRGWIADRVAWVIMLLIAVCAVLGLFGGGVLSERTVKQSRDGLGVTFDRFGRRGADTVVAVHVPAGLTEQGTAILGVRTSYLNTMKIDNVVPQPDRVTAGDAAQLYSFSAPGGQDLTVVFDLTPNEVGSVHGRISAGAGRARLEFDQFFFP